MDHEKLLAIGLVLFFGALIFVVRNWGKNSGANVMLVLGMVVLIFASIPLLDDRSGREELFEETAPVTELPSDSALAKAEKARESSKAKKYWVQQALLENTKTKNTESAPETKVQQSPRIQRVSVKQAGQYIGYPVTVIMKDLRVRHGTIRSIRLGEMTLEDQVNSGSISYHLALGDIHSLEVSRP